MISYPRKHNSNALAVGEVTGACFWFPLELLLVSFAQEILNVRVSMWVDYAQNFVYCSNFEKNVLASCSKCGNRFVAPKLYGLFSIAPLSTAFRSFKKRKFP